ncbi:NAD(P)H-dependent oxidoreductase [Flavisphingomonas formosensis]|uniref:NAD(P)H-dependent oxidoreductase n=1 Tax=Flavisphingomonas formosensis TaxID=861534 RepID=UPI0012FB64B8|nr:NAD(P)H-dependent oxidoreductase [Sphingomonas formosensis]
MPANIVRHAVILTHPNPRSFNSAIAETYCETVRECGQSVVLRDLYRIGFDPALKADEQPGPMFAMSADVRVEWDAVKGSDMFTLIFPIWFGLPPAMMKGYVDRVVGAGVTPRQIQERDGCGLLRGSNLLSISTSGAPEAWLDEQGQQEALRDVASRYLFRAFAMKTASTLHFGGIVQDLPKRVVDEHLHTVRERTRKLCARLAVEKRDRALPPKISCSEH